jgi:hypothetical protein
MNFTQYRYYPVLEPFIALLGFLGLVIVLGPWWGVYQFNTDEGINLAKADLVSNGFVLYTEIWSDQPPLMTYILAAINLLGLDGVHHARAVILGFGGLAIMSMFILVRQECSRFAAWVTVILLATSQLFLKFVVAILIGLPAIALSVFAMMLISVSNVKNYRWSVLGAGVVFGLALQIKMFVFLLAPVIVLVILFSKSHLASNAPRAVSFLKSLLILMLGTLSSVCLVALISGGFVVDQLVFTHTQASDISLLANRGGIQYIWNVMRVSETHLVVFSGISAVILIVNRNPAIRVPLAWIAITVIALSFHRPLWKHHFLLFIVPLCWFAGVGMDQLKEFIANYSKGNMWTKNTAMFVIILIIAVSGFGSLVGTHQRYTYREKNLEPLERLRWFTSGSNWVITDFPLDAYRADLLVPPDLAVFSEKRVLTGKLTVDDVRTALDEFSASQVSLRRNDLRSINTDLTSDLFSTRKYSMWSVMGSRNYKHYVTESGLNSLIKIPLDSLAAKESVNWLYSILFDLSYIPDLYGYGGVYFHKYAHRYDGFKEGIRLTRNVVVSQLPHSTQQIGQCFLSANQIVSHPQLLDEAMAAAKALACTQSPQGNWHIASTQSDKCEPGDHTGPRTVNPELVDSESLASIFEFANSLKNELAVSSKNVPDWLDNMITRATPLLESTRVLSQTPGNPPKWLAPPGVKISYKDNVFDHDNLSKNNPDGYQTTMELVQQCQAAISAVSRI